MFLLPPRPNGSERHILEYYVDHNDISRERFCRLHEKKIVIICFEYILNFCSGGVFLSFLLVEGLWSRPTCSNIDQSLLLCDKSLIWSIHSSCLKLIDYAWYSNIHKGEEIANHQVDRFWTKASVPLYTFHINQLPVALLTDSLHTSIYQGIDCVWSRQA